MAPLRTTQDRLGKFQDKIRIKLIDNIISLSGAAVDAIRIRVKTNRNGDIESRIIEKNDVVNVIFPTLSEVPMRRLINDSGTFTVDSLSVQELFPFEITVSQEDDIKRGDILIRILRDGKASQPYVMALQVKDDSGSFGQSSLLWQKKNATYYDEFFPQEVIDIIVDMANRRFKLGW